VIAPVQPPVAPRHAWLDHPLIAAHYRARAAIDGLNWEAWISHHLGRAPVRGLHLLSGRGARAFYVFENGWADAIDGVDGSEDAVLQAERSRETCRAPGVFRVADINTVRLRRRSYDLIFICHGLHQVTALERLLDQVYEALTPDGLFVVEGYVGPSRFQWTDAQIAMTDLVLSWMPDRLRLLPWGAIKTHEARPERRVVAAQSAFEGIRSGESLHLLRERFAPVVERRLGGTLQQMLYNGIMQNFTDEDAEARVHLERAWQLEDALIDTGLLASDFFLAIGRRR
jgi:SAM-dependent methyltransferase